MYHLQMTSVVEKNNSPDIAGGDLLLHQQYFILNSSENLVSHWERAFAFQIFIWKCNDLIYYVSFAFQLINQNYNYLIPQILSRESVSLSQINCKVNVEHWVSWQFKMYKSRIILIEVFGIIWTGWLGLVELWLWT